MPVIAKAERRLLPEFGEYVGGILLLLMAIEATRSAILDDSFTVAVAGKGLESPTARRRVRCLGASCG